MRFFSFPLLKSCKDFKSIAYTALFKSKTCCSLVLMRKTITMVSFKIVDFNEGVFEDFKQQYAFKTFGFNKQGTLVVRFNKQGTLVVHRKQSSASLLKSSILKAKEAAKTTRWFLYAPFCLLKSLQDFKRVGC